jgi:hypothetical protein
MATVISSYGEIRDDDDGDSVMISVGFIPYCYYLM